MTQINNTSSFTFFPLRVSEETFASIGVKKKLHPVRHESEIKKKEVDGPHRKKKTKLSKVSCCAGGKFTSEYHGNDFFFFFLFALEGEFSDIEVEGYSNKQKQENRRDGDDTMKCGRKMIFCVFFVILIIFCEGGNPRLNARR